MKPFIQLSRVIGAVVLVFCMAPSAQAAPKFSVVGNLNYGLSKVEGTMTDPIMGSVAGSSKGALGYGGGVLVEFAPGNWGVELGAQYLIRNTTVTVFDIPITADSSALHIPVMARLGQNLSFGVGGYVDLSLETGGGTSYGLIAGPRFTTGMGLFFDGRFVYDLKSRDNPFKAGETFNPMEAQLLVGYQFGKK